MSPLVPFPGSTSGVQDLPRRPDRRPTTRRTLRHQWTDHRPLGIGQVGFVTKAHAAMPPPGGRGPHGASKSGFSTLLEAPPSRPLNPAPHPYRTGSYLEIS